MLKKVILCLVVVVVFLMISGGWYWFDQPATKVKVTPPLVRMAAAKLATKAQSITAIGTIIAPKDVTLMAQQSGTIESVNFKSGQHVKKGHVLFVVDSATQKAVLAQKQASLDNSKAEYKRYLKLNRQQGVISQEDFDKVKSEYLLDLAAVNEAKKALDETRVIAPFDGTISAPQPVRGRTDNDGNSLSNITQLAPGSYVNVGDALVELVDKQHMLIQYALPQANLHQTALNQSVLATTNAYPGQSFKGKVVYISPSLNTVNRTFAVRSSIDNHSGKLSPGMLVTVAQVINPDTKVLLVPANSVMMDLQGYHVYILKNGKVASQKVTVGQRYGTGIAILSGLKAGQMVISSGLSSVKEGQRVRAAK